MKTTVLEISGIAFVVAGVTYAVYLCAGIDWALASLLVALGAFLTALAWAIDRNTRPAPPPPEKAPNSKVINLAEKALINEILKNRAS